MRAVYISVQFSSGRDFRPSGIDIRIELVARPVDDVFGRYPVEPCHSVQTLAFDPAMHDTVHRKDEQILARLQRVRVSPHLIPVSP